MIFIFYSVLCCSVSLDDIGSKPGVGLEDVQSMHECVATVMALRISNDLL